MQLSHRLLLLFVLSSALPSEAYRILGLFPFHAKSHFQMYGQLMKGLAERGHQVDVVSHFPIKKPIPNYNDIVSLAGTIPNVVNNVSLGDIKDMQPGGSMIYGLATMAGNEICNLMNHPGIKNLIDNPPTDPPYDVVITEVFGANCYAGVGHHLKVPVVGLTSCTMMPWANDYIANPDNPAYIPNLFSNFMGNMNFWQRILNTILNIYLKREFSQVTERQGDIMKNYIGEHIPGIREVERNISLILVNSHYSLNGVRPLTTAVVEVGGLHIDEREATLPKDLLKWLDDSKDGFVFISFGSMLKIESLPKAALTALYSSLAKLAPVRVLIKVAKPEELPPGLPSNALTSPWVPQLGVLKHKNIRAFMTHGGLMGTQEAIYFGVPMIGVPFFGDQSQNIELYAKLNIAVMIDQQELTEKNLDAAFNKVLRDPSYMKSTKKMSALFRDRPMSAMDTAIFWVEYVVRNGGATIRSPAMDLAWWQISLIDVYGFLFSCAALAVCLVFIAIKKLKAMLFPSKVSLATRSKKDE